MENGTNFNSKQRLCKRFSMTFKLEDA